MSRVAAPSALVARAALRFLEMLVATPSLRPMWGWDDWIFAVGLACRDNRVLVRAAAASAIATALKQDASLPRVEELREELAADARVAVVSALSSPLIYARWDANRGQTAR